MMIGVDYHPSFQQIIYSITRISMSTEGPATSAH